MNVERSCWPEDEEDNVRREESGEMEREGMEDDGEILEGTSLFREESSSQVAKEASDLIVVGTYLR